jgi:hypothetical protein
LSGKLAKESCSDGSIIRYAAGQGKGHRLQSDSQDVRYIVKKDNKEIFQRNLLRLAEKKFCKTNKEGETENLDKTLCSRLSDETDIEKIIENSTKS